MDREIANPPLQPWEIKVIQVCSQRKVILSLSHNFRHEHRNLSHMQKALQTMFGEGFAARRNIRSVELNIFPTFKF